MQIVFNSECVKVEWDDAAGEIALSMHETEMVAPAPRATTALTDERPRRTVTLVGVCVRWVCALCSVWCVVCGGWCVVCGVWCGV